jgi:hypothetical protein
VAPTFHMLEAAIVRMRPVNGHLRGDPRLGLLLHLEVNVRALHPVKPMKRTIPDLTAAPPTRRLRQPCP